MHVSTADIVIVGGSTAGLRAAEAAARHAPDLTVAVVSQEAHLPYELPPLSKTRLDEPLQIDSLVYPLATTLRESGVAFLLNTRAEALDTRARTLRLSDGNLHYGALVIATGCEPIIPPMFAGLPDVHTLRRFEDALALRAAVADSSRSVAVVGAGFIGGEFASTMVKAGRKVSLVDLAAKPLVRFGEQVSDAYETLHREAGVDLRLGEGVVDVVENGGSRALLLADGTLIAADVIVVGVGVRPSLGWLDGSGLVTDNGIVCDEALQAADGVFAAGDAVRWRNPRFGAVMRIEHWTTAAEQGRAAGLNAARTLRGESPEACSSVPYFWSDQHNVRIQFAGHRTGDEEVVESRREGGTLFLYRQGDRLAGVVAFERRSEFVRIRAKLRTELPWEDVEELLTPASPVPPGR